MCTIHIAYIPLNVCVSKTPQEFGGVYYLYLQIVSLIVSLLLNLQRHIFTLYAFIVVSAYILLLYCIHHSFFLNIKCYSPFHMNRRSEVLTLSSVEIRTSKLELSSHRGLSDWSANSACTYTIVWLLSSCVSLFVRTYTCPLSVSP